MKTSFKRLSSKENKSEIEEGTAAAISKTHDISDKKCIMPLIDFVQAKKRSIGVDDTPIQ